MGVDGEQAQRRAIAGFGHVLVLFASFVGHAVTLSAEGLPTLGGPAGCPARAAQRAVVSDVVRHRRGTPFAILAVAAALVIVAAACDTGDGTTLQPAGPDQTASMVNPTTTTTIVGASAGAPGQGVGEDGLTLRAPWEDEADIPALYTCVPSRGKAGTGVSPAIEWTGVPAGTNNLALVVTDLSANGFVHWAVVGIPPTSPGVVQGQEPVGGVVGRNSFGTAGYGGPCPPAGAAAHEYLFQLYALDRDLGFQPGFDARSQQAAIEAASSSAVSLVGRFGRPAAAGAAATVTTRAPAPTQVTVKPGPSPT